MQGFLEEALGIFLDGVCPRNSIGINVPTNGGIKNRLVTPNLVGWVISYPFG